MKSIPAIFRYELLNVQRGKWFVFYTLLFAGFSESILQFGTNPGKAVASLMSIVLLIVPLVSSLYASIYWYNSEGFTSLLLTQPLRRGRLYVSRWLAISMVLSLSFVIGTFTPIALNSAVDGGGLLLLALGSVLTFIFTGLGMLSAMSITDRMKGIGLAFMIWFYFAIVHDALVFLGLSIFHEYPLEIPTMLVTAVNPIDLVRVTLLRILDFSALMGYTGTILQRAISGISGIAMIAVILSFWVVVPLVVGKRVFEAKDL